MRRTQPLLDWPSTCQVQTWLQNHLSQFHTYQPLPSPTVLTATLAKVDQYTKLLQTGAGYWRRRWYKWWYQINHAVDGLYQWQCVYGTQGTGEQALQIQQTLAHYSQTVAQSPLPPLPDQQAIVYWQHWGQTYHCLTMPVTKDPKPWFMHLLQQARRVANFKRRPNLDKRILIACSSGDVWFQIRSLKRPLPLAQVIKNVRDYQRLSWLGRLIKRSTQTHIKQQQHLLAYYQDRWSIEMLQQQRPPDNAVGDIVANASADVANPRAADQCLQHPLAPTDNPLQADEKTSAFTTQARERLDDAPNEAALAWSTPPSHVLRQWQIKMALNKYNLRYLLAPWHDAVIPGWQALCLKLQEATAADAKVTLTELMNDIAQLRQCMANYLEHCKMQYPDLSSFFTAAAQAHDAQLAMLQTIHNDDARQKHCADWYANHCQQLATEFHDLHTASSSFSDFYFRYNQMWEAFQKSCEEFRERLLTYNHQIVWPTLIHQGCAALAEQTLRHYKGLFKRALHEAMTTQAVQVHFDNTDPTAACQALIARIKHAYSTPAHETAWQTLLDLDTTTKPWDLDFQQRLSHDYENLRCWLKFCAESDATPYTALLHDLDSTWQTWQACRHSLNECRTYFIKRTSAPDKMEETEETDFPDLLKEAEASAELIPSHLIHGRLQHEWPQFETSVLCQWQVRTKQIWRRLSEQLSDVNEMTATTEMKDCVQQLHTEATRALTELAQSLRAEYPDLPCVVALWFDTYRGQLLAWQKANEEVIKLVQIGEHYVATLMQKLITLSDHQASVNNYYEAYQAVYIPFRDAQTHVVNAYRAAQEALPPFLWVVSQKLLIRAIQPKITRFNTQLAYLFYQTVLGRHFARDVQVPAAQSSALVVHPKFRLCNTPPECLYWQAILDQHVAMDAQALEARYSPRQALQIWQQHIDANFHWTFEEEKMDVDPRVLLAEQHTRILQQYTVLSQLNERRKDPLRQRTFLPPDPMDDWEGLSVEQVREQLHSYYKSWCCFRETLEDLYYDSGYFTILEHVPIACLEASTKHTPTSPDKMYEAHTIYIGQLQEIMRKRWAEIIKKNAVSLTTDLKIPLINNANSMNGKYMQLIHYHTQQVNAQLGAQYKLFKELGENKQSPATLATLKEYQSFDEKTQRILHAYTQTLRGSNSVTALNAACQTACEEVVACLYAHVNDSHLTRSLLEYAAKNLQTQIRTQAQYYQQFLLANDDKLIASSLYNVHLLVEAFTVLKSYFYEFSVLINDIIQQCRQRTMSDKTLASFRERTRQLQLKLHPDTLNSAHQRAKDEYVRVYTKQTKGAHWSVFLTALDKSVRDVWSKKLHEAVSTLTNLLKNIDRSETQAMATQSILIALQEMTFGKKPDLTTVKNVGTFSRDSFRDPNYSSDIDPYFKSSRKNPWGRTICPALTIWETALNGELKNQLDVLEEQQQALRQHLNESKAQHLAPAGPTLFAANSAGHHRPRPSTTKPNDEPTSSASHQP